MTYRSLQIVSERPLIVAGDCLVFEALDRAGSVHIWIPALVWERLQAEAPDYCDAADRRDYALGMIETRAAELTPGVASNGQRIIMIG